MCGLFGWVTNRQAPARVLAILASAMESRGSHSWGLGYLSKNRVYRLRNTGSVLKATPCLAPQTARSKALIGHTRWATTGAVTVENAHPFRFGKFLLAHNGTISNWRTKQREGRKHEVDSMTLLDAIAHRESTEEIQGYGAVLYIHISKATVHAARLRNGDLEAAYIEGTAKGEKDFHGVVLASTTQPFKALREAGFKVKQLPTPLEEHDYIVHATGLEDTGKRWPLKSGYYQSWQSSGSYSSSGNSTTCRKLKDHYGYYTVTEHGEAEYISYTTGKSFSSGAVSGNAYGPSYKVIVREAK